MLVEPSGFRAAWAEDARGRGRALDRGRHADVCRLDGERRARSRRDGFSIAKVAPAAGRSAPAAGVPDPGTAQAIAYEMVLARGWDQAEFNCLVALWNRESRWNVYAHNERERRLRHPAGPPGRQDGDAPAPTGPTNPATQITWGLGYIAGRYGTPCGAWAHSEAKGWY